MDILGSAGRYDPGHYLLDYQVSFEKISAKVIGLQAFAEYRFAEPRKWRFDWAWPICKIALEIEGGVWTKGRHTRGSGFLKDMEKYNEAAILGWRVLRVTPQQFESGDAILLVQRAMGEK